jgi:hypothetical protein
MAHAVVETCPTLRIHTFARAEVPFGWATWGTGRGVVWTVDRAAERATFGAQSIELVSTAPHLGGLRWWALCPGCRGRCALLYAGPSGLRCRACYRLAYASTRESPQGRALRRRAKLRARLGADPGPACPPPVRPRGMWRSRFARLSEEVDRTDMLALAMLDRSIERLERRVGLARLG